MNFEHPLFLLVVGSIVVASMLIKDRLERIHVPPLLGYIGVGLGLAVADERWQILLPAADWALEFLADVGVVCLLFRVGLTSNPLALYRQLPRVIPVWTGDVVCAALSGYAAARYGLGFPHLSALVVATALSATSLGVTAGVWSVGGAIRSRLGQQLVDVAELDDLSTVLLMVLLFSAVPMVAAAEPTEGSPGSSSPPAPGWR